MASVEISSGNASSVVFRFGSPRSAASICQLSEYPSPLKTTAPWLVMISVSSSCTAVSKSMPSPTAVSNSVAM